MSYENFLGRVYTDSDSLCLTSLHNIQCCDDIDVLHSIVSKTSPKADSYDLMEMTFDFQYVGRSARIFLKYN